MSVRTWLLPLVALPAVLAAQAVPTRTLTTPEAEFDDAFSSLSFGAVRELSNGKVIVADSREKTVQLVTFGGSAVPIGREGSGPGEFSLPMRLYAAPGDTTWLWDIGNSRFLVIAPNGKPVTTFTIAGASPIPVGAPATAGGGRSGGGGGAVRTQGGGVRGVSLGQVEGVDSRGRLYLRGSPITFGEQGPVAADSAAIMRYDRRTNKVDTIGYYSTAGTQVRSSSAPAQGGGGQAVTMTVTRSVGGSNAFRSMDTWTVTPDGRVAKIFAADYHVELWGEGGRRVPGPPIPFEKVRVTEADKKQFMEARRNAPGIRVSNTNGRTEISDAAVSALNRNIAEAEVDFPEVKGPYSTFAAAPDGRLWVQRQMPFGALPTYDVLDATGKLVQRVAFPKGTRVVGFGARGAIYTARADEDDLQYLQRFRM